MAKIVLSSQELVHILGANALIPDQVTGVETNGEEITVRVNTQWPVLKSIRVGIRFAGFDDGSVVLQLVTNRFIDTFDWLVDRMLEPLRLEEHGGRWEYPRLYIDVNKVIQRQLRGIEIESIVFHNGYFHITTRHADAGKTIDGPSDEQDRFDEKPDAAG